MCLSSRSVNVVQEDSEDSSLFLGSVSADKEDPWTVNLLLRNRKVQFKIDTGADVTVIPDYVFNTVYGKGKPSLQRATKPLGPSGAPLDVLGTTDIRLQRGEKSTVEEVFVIWSLHTALLGRSASVKLGFVARLKQH